MAELEVRGLTKTFGPVTAVRDVSFTAPAGAVTGLLGPNGSGKPVTGLRLSLLRPGQGTRSAPDGLGRCCDPEYDPGQRAARRREQQRPAGAASGGRVHKRAHDGDTHRGPGLARGVQQAASCPSSLVRGSVDHRGHHGRQRERTPVPVSSSAKASQP
jgi:hypothetical protein